MNVKFDLKIGEGITEFVSMLAVAFICLKLCGVINWSWIWVVSPIWISYAVIGIISLIVYVVYKKKGYL